MGVFKLVGNFRAWVGARVDAKMNTAAEDGATAARRAAPVRTGFLRASIGATYDPGRKKITLYGTAPYTTFQDRGFISRSGRAIPGKHFMSAGVQAIARRWGGEIEVSYPTTAPQYHAQHPPRVVYPNAQTAKLATRARAPRRRR